MVVRKSIVEAADHIDAALEDFVHHRAEAKVLVFANDLGHLHAVVATQGFEGIASEERVRRIWEHLRVNVPTEDLGCLYRVYAFTREEYDARVGQSASATGVAEWLDLDGETSGPLND